MVGAEVLKKLDERFHQITIIPRSEIVQGLFHERCRSEDRRLNHSHNRSRTWDKHPNDSSDGGFNLQYSLNHLFSLRSYAFNISHFHSPIRVYQTTILQLHVERSAQR